MKKVIYVEELIKNIRKYEKEVTPTYVWNETEYHVGVRNACDLIIDMIEAAAFEEEERGEAE